MGIVGDFPQERRVFRIGRGDGRDSVAAAMLQLLFRGGESSAADDFAGDLFAQARFARQFVRSRGEMSRALPNTPSRCTAPFTPIPGVI